MTQLDILQDGEADAWWARNKDKLPPVYDPVLHIIEKNGLKPASVLEIGCANGWRLEEIQRMYRSRCNGCDISLAALQEGRRKFPGLWYGDTSKLPYMTSEFELVIFGFCLYLVDREDLFKTVAESDRVLKDGGHLIIYDFHSYEPKAAPYHHDTRLKTYRMEYWKLWEANPTYTRVDWAHKDDYGVWLLKKDMGIWQ